MQIVVVTESRCIRCLQRLHHHSTHVSSATNPPDSLSPLPQCEELLLGTKTKRPFVSYLYSGETHQLAPLTLHRRCNRLYSSWSRTTLTSPAPQHTQLCGHGEEATMPAIDCEGYPALPEARRERGGRERVCG